MSDHISERHISRNADKSLRRLRRAFLERCNEHTLGLSYRAPVFSDPVEFTSGIGSDVRFVTLGTVYGRDILDDDERTATTKASCHFFDGGCLCTAEITLHDRYSR
jgi:hypothetical protein